MTDHLTVICGDALTELRKLPSERIQCCVTSPPYWGLRDYSCEGQLGLERTPEQYVAKMVEIFREVRRVLRKDGTLWLNLGDSYAGSPVGTFNGGGFKDSSARTGGRDLSGIESGSRQSKVVDGLKPKDLCGIPWRVAFALQADGWWLRSDIIWAKPNPMPESVTDRPTKSHEYLFLLTKASSYFYDSEAVREPVKESQDGSIRARARTANGAFGGENQHNIEERFYERICGANKRSVWTVATAPFSGAHFATFPPDLVKPCIMAGTSAKGCCAKCGAPWERVVERAPMVIDRTDRMSEMGEYGRYQSSGTMLEPAKVETLGWKTMCKCSLGSFTERIGVVPCTVLDPFAGSGTTGMVALELGRKAVLIELNPVYAALIEQRTSTTLGLALA